MDEIIFNRLMAMIMIAIGFLALMMGYTKEAWITLGLTVGIYTLANYLIRKEKKEVQENGTARN